MFIRFRGNFPATCLFHPTRLLGTIEYVYTYVSNKNIRKLTKLFEIMHAKTNNVD